MAVTGIRGGDILPKDLVNAMIRSYNLNISRNIMFNSKRWAYTISAGSQADTTGEISFYWNQDYRNRIYCSYNRGIRHYEDMEQVSQHPAFPVSHYANGLACTGWVFRGQHAPGIILVRAKFHYSWKSLWPAND